MELDIWDKIFAVITVILGLFVTALAIYAAMKMADNMVAVVGLSALACLLPAITIFAAVLYKIKYSR